MTSINFDGHNLGFQAGIINGSVSTGTSAFKYVQGDFEVSFFNN